MNRHLTTLERLFATIAIIFAVAQFLLVVVNASSSTSTTLPSALSRRQLLSSHNTNNRNVCESSVTQSNATIEETGIEKKSSSLLAVRAFHEALNNLLIVRSAISTINTSSSSPQLFKIGTIVELYRDESYFATPAIITSTTSNDDNSNSLTLQNTITGSSYSTIETSPSHNIHTYTQYTDGTRASCNISPPNSNEVYMTPCVVNTSYVRENSGLILYEVSYLDDNDSLVRERLPFSRVQRRRQPLISEL